MPRRSTPAAAVAVGSDADLVVWDPSATKTVTAAKQASRIGYNVFEDYACQGLPRVTLSRGKVAFRRRPPRPATANTSHASPSRRCTPH